MERGFDYNEKDEWKYQFSKYPTAGDPEAYEHTEDDKDNALNLIGLNHEAADGAEPFSDDNLLYFGNLLSYFVLGEYKTDTSGLVKTAFDAMRIEWENCFPWLVGLHPTKDITELIVEVKEQQDNFFRLWYDILDEFRYENYSRYQIGEYNECNEYLSTYTKLAKNLRIKLKASELLKERKDEALKDAGRTEAAKAFEKLNLAPIKNQLYDIQATTNDLAEELTKWREWVRELAMHPNAKPSEPKLCATVQKKVCDIWQGFKAASADCELPGGGLRKTKRTFDECLALCRHDEVWHGKRLIDFISDAKAFERVVHNANEKARQAKAKAKPLKSQKRKTQARRKK